MGKATVGDDPPPHTRAGRSTPTTWLEFGDMPVLKGLSAVLGNIRAEVGRSVH